MSKSNLIAELQSYRVALDKVITSKDVNSQEEVLDILKAIEKIPMTIELLRECRLGASLQELRSIYKESPINNLSKKLLLEWKKSCVIASSASVASGFTTEATELSKPVSATKPSIQRAKSDDSALTEEDSWNDAEYLRLNQTRRNTIDALASILSKSGDIHESFAKLIAVNIESAVNQALPESADQKAYLKKARTLGANLRMNEQLRQDVISQEITFEQLANASNSELASKEIREERQKVMESTKLARRSDIYNIAREKIQKANGIDASGGEFQCRKCKGTKTSHYSLQTRSSDEPMTVFVCCLNCGTRWRC